MIEAGIGAIKNQENINNFVFIKFAKNQTIDAYKKKGNSNKYKSPIFGA